MLTSLVLIAIILLIQIVFYVFSEYINMSEPEFYLFITILIWLAGSLFGLTLTQIVTSAYYATGNTHTVMKVAAVSYTVFIPVKIYLYSLYGVSGLAAVASLYMIANLLVLGALFKPQGTVHNV
jgi:peptidoglycan biosynthesis protein MviN/MurJ (putative lipid II flippase)